MPDVYLTDLSTCQPSDALSPEWRDGRWMLLPYETADGLSGTMVYYTYYPLFHAAMRRPAGGSFLNPPEISLPLPVGRFAIHLAMQYATNSRLEGPQIRVRLSTEDTVFTVESSNVFAGKCSSNLYLVPFELVTVKGMHWMAEL